MSFLAVHIEPLAGFIAGIIARAVALVGWVLSERPKDPGRRLVVGAAPRWSARVMRRTPPAGGTRALAAAIAALVLVQAVIAGRSTRLFGSWDIGIHGILGNIVFGLALVNLALLALRRASRAEIGTAAALVIVFTAQLGLGYAGRERLAAAGWHIPVGVAAFGLAVWNLALLTRPGGDRG